MIEPGRICIKIAGREAKRVCCIIENIDNKYVLVDGNVKRKKCNIKHLEPLNKTIKITKASTSEKIKDLLKKEGFEIEEKKGKREAKEKPKKKKKVKPKKEKIKEPKPKENTNDKKTGK